MKNDSSACTMDNKLVSLIDQGKHFGTSGAITYFKQKYFTDMHGNMAVGDFRLVMMYLNVLYSAMAYASKGNVCMKLRIFWLLLVIGCTVKFVQPVSIRMKFQSGEHHILLSIAARQLQILKKFRLINICTKMRERILEDFWVSFLLIRELANEESANGTQSSITDLGPSNLSFLMAEGLCYELFTDGILHLPDALRIKDRIWMFAAHHELTKDRDLAQVVARLFRAIRHNDEASNVASRVQNLDQLAKSTSN